jgi:cardiolipin synthase
MHHSAAGQRPCGHLPRDKRLPWVSLCSRPALTSSIPAGLPRLCRAGWCPSPLAAALLLLGLLAHSGPLPAAVTPREARTAEQLDAIRDQAPPRVFVKRDNVRLYFPDADGSRVFKADWRLSQLQGQGFRYQIATLKHDRTPPEPPKPDGAWRSAVVLDRPVWSELAEAARRELAPTDPNTGLYFQTQLNDGVIYRDAAGVIKSVPLGQQPPEVQITSRRGKAEMALTLARLAEQRLRAAYPGEELFCLTQNPGGRGVAFILLDLNRRNCILLGNPHTDDDPRGAPQVVPTVRSLGSLAIESHGVALVRNPISSSLRLLHISTQTLAGLLPAAGGRGGPPPPLNPADAPMDRAAWEAELDDLTDTELEPGSVRFLIGGEQFFPVLFERIAAATNAIDFRICIFDTDDVAVAVADALKRRSSEVRVRVLYDLMSSQAASLSAPASPMREGFVPPDSIGAYLERGSQVKARAFLNPWFSSEHSKVLSFDNATSFLGGMNLGREYRYEWHDLMAEVRGPIVARFTRDFSQAWAHAGPGGDLAFASASLTPRLRPAPAARKEWAALRRLYTRPGETAIRKAVLKSLTRARQRVWLENPYLYDPAVLAGLLAARARGVDVRVVLAGEHDLDLGRRSTLVTANTLQRGGVRVYLYPGMTHAKALVVDGWATFGSANFNKLSLRTNHECNLATSDPGIVNALARDLFEVDFAKSHELTEAIEVSWTDELADRILGQF